MKIPINETKPTDEERDIKITPIWPSQVDARVVGDTGWISPYPLPEPTKEMLRAIELFDEMHREIEATMSPLPSSTVMVFTDVIDGALVRRAIRAAEMYERQEPEWPMTLVISQHHYEDPEFMEQLGDQPYVVTPRHIPIAEAAKRCMMDIVERVELKGIEFKEAVRDREPRPSFRERFPNDPVRNRKARKGWRRR